MIYPRSNRSEARGEGTATIWMIRNERMRREIKDQLTSVSTMDDSTTGERTMGRGRERGRRKAEYCNGDVIDYG